jgi:hypothetical protein
VLGSCVIGAATHNLQVVGRGGQAVLALVSYKVYTMALLRLMERNPVSYGTFEAVTLQDSSLSATFQTSRDLFLNQGPRAKATVLWMTISAAFVIAFPTMVSAMTGYSSTVEAVVTVNGTFIPFSDFQMVRYVIHDGDRVPGLSKDYLVTSSRDAAGKLSILIPCVSCFLVATLLSQDEQALPFVQTHGCSIHVWAGDHGSLISRQALFIPIGHKYRRSAS